MSLLIQNNNYTSLHFTGVLGAGMSALAQYTRWIGCEVSGSDRALGKEETRKVSQFLSSIGCALFAQDGSGIGEQTGAIIVSSAIEENNPEIVRARQLGIPVFHRSDVLAALVQTKKTIAVAGTSGKSTVTAMIFHLLQSCGQNPSLITGAGLKSLEQKGMPGNALYQQGQWLVIEADESDGSLVKYHPHITLLLNVSKDHKTVRETIELFSALAKQSDIVVKNGDDEQLASIEANYRFGRNATADFRMEALESPENINTFRFRGESYSVPLPGEHNADNLFASIVCGLLCDCTQECLRDAGRRFQGLHRRFSVAKTKRKVIVVDDYAHNPAKIKAAISAAHSLSNRLFILFQPHGFGPMKFMRNELAAMFRQSIRAGDDLYILPIYYAGGNVIKDISSAELASDLKGCDFTVHSPTHRDHAVEDIAARAREGDLILSMGARDPSLDGFAQQIADRVNGT